MAEARFDPRNCVCAGLRKASRAVTQLYDDELRPSGMRSTQFNILSTIRAMGAANLTQLEAFLLLEQTTLTRSLVLMERKGWIERVPVPDGRKKTLRLTERGARLVDNATPLWQRAQEKMTQPPLDEKWAVLQQTLTALIEAAGA